jgi:hypothetical protein
LTPDDLHHHPLSFCSWYFSQRCCIRLEGKK